MFSAATSHGTNFTAHSIYATAMGRWLNVGEIEALLDPNTTILNLSQNPPSSPPPSGSLLLYNRSVTRNYKDDGYKWIKKRNSHKVREDHVKLRVGGKFRVSGCYVHGASTVTLHRRAYHLLNPDTGTAMYPVSSANSRNNSPSYVLVHYLDTEIASKHSANMIRNQSVVPAIPKAINNATLNDAAFLQRNMATLANNGPISNIAIAQTQQQLAAMATLSDTLNNHQSRDSFSSHFSYPQHSHADVSEPFSSSLTGLETLDFLWDVIFDEGKEKLEQTLANSNFPVDPSVIKGMIEAQDGGHIHSESDLKSYLDQAAREMSQNADSQKVSSIPEMVEIVDVTPNRADTGMETKIVISCKDPICNQRSDSQNSTFVWHTLAAFVDVHRDDEMSCPKASSVNLFITEMLNPYTCRVRVPPMSLELEQHIIIVSVFLESTTDPLCQGVAASIGLVLEQSWNEQMNCSSSNNNPKSYLHLSTASHTIVKDRPFIRFLTQMSQEQFHCTPPERKTSATSSDDDDKDSELPAPPHYMAMVATALSDFPNPPVRAVLPQTTTLSFTGPDNIQQTKALSEITEPETKKMIQASMEAKVDHKESNLKKRASSCIEIGPVTENEVPVLASAWASKPSSMPRIDTKAEEVDRHCKIRFVERLNDVIGEAELNGAAVDDEQIKSMDDEELDQILGGLLVQIVESLAEMEESGLQIHEELDTPDKSGFCILHYAALYDLPSLIPVLLSHGADPNIRTSRGNLTPLHLACGSGNDTIVEVLVRHGCDINPEDCFGSTPCDHAIRNGFPNVAEFIGAQIIKERAFRSANRENAHEPSIYQASERLEIYEQDKFLLQSAFANLSLKDKLIFNMMVRKRGRASQSQAPHMSPVIEEGNEESANKEVLVDSCGDVEMNDVSMNHNKVAKDKDPVDVDSVLTESDKESLDIAMKLMNKEELEDIEKKTGDSDLREWMMKRHYESLMQASQHLQKTLTKHGETKKRDKEIDGLVKSAETVRSLQNMKRQALAGLVIRKNVIKPKKGKKAGEKLPPMYEEKEVDASNDSYAQVAETAAANVSFGGKNASSDSNIQTTNTASPNHGYASSDSNVQTTNTASPNHGYASSDSSVQVTNAASPHDGYASSDSNVQTTNAASPNHGYASSDSNVQTTNAASPNHGYASSDSNVQTTNAAFPNNGL